MGKESRSGGRSPRDGGGQGVVGLGVGDPGVRV